jgi:peroxiredoxin
LDKNKNINCYDIDSYTNLDDRIHLVDSLIKDKGLRKTYFERFIQEEIIYAEDADDLSHTHQLIEKLNFSDKEKNRLISLVEFQSALIVDADLKDVMLKCKDLKRHKLKDVIKKNHAVIYSWSLQSPSHHKLRIRTIKQLMKKYNDIQFIGINIDYNFQDEWLTAVNSLNDNIENEFTIIPGEHSEFYRNYLNKIFFISKDCTIKKSEIVLSNQDLDGHIQDYLSHY